MSRHGPRSTARAAGDLAKALVRLPWNLALWGAQQAADLANPSRSWQRNVAALDDLSHAAERPLTGALGNLQRAGDHLQSGLIDSAAHLATGSWREPRTAFDEGWETLAGSWRLLVGDGGEQRR